MAISHADHDHANTPAARAKCRRELDNTHLSGETVRKEYAKASANNTKPKAATRRLKVSGVKITQIGDLADVPRVLALEVRRAWALDWTVQAGHPFNDDERRIVITGPKAEIALVWNSNGETGTFVRHHNSSVTRRLDTPDEAFDAADTDDAWDGHGNYIGL